MRRMGRCGVGLALTIAFAMIWPGGFLRAGAAGEAGLVTAPAETPPESQETEAYGRTYLGIDSHYKYEGMEQSFSEGYQPAVRDGALYLVIPFTASGDLSGDRLTVSLMFPEGAASAFLPRNYQKTVGKRRYALRDGTMVCLGAGGRAGSFGPQESLGRGEPAGSMGLSGQTGPSGQGEREAYLYCMEIPLSGTVPSGPCALTVQAVGYTERMEQVSFTRQIVFSLPEGGKPDGEDKTGDHTGDKTGDQADDPNKGTAGGEDEPGDQAGSGEEGEDGEKGGDFAGSGAGEGGGSGAGTGAGGGSGEEELIRQPKILLESDSLSGRALAAGSEEKLTVTFRNCSGTQPLYNLKMSASVEGSGLRFSRNSFYVASASPGETIVLETDLSVAPDAACGEIPVVFEFEYEDKRGNALSGRETMTLSVRQPAKLECQAGEIPGAVYASDTMELSLKACNISRAPIYNVQASLSAEGLFPDGDVFLGNLEAGAAGEGTMQIYVGTRTMESMGVDAGGSDGEKYGPVEGTVTFRYEDGDGEVYEETRPFQTEIKKAQIVSFAAEEPEETNSWGMSVAAAAFAGLVFWILLLLFRLRKKNALLAERRGTQ